MKMLHQSANGETTVLGGVAPQEGVDDRLVNNGENGASTRWLNGSPSEGASS